MALGAVLSLYGVMTFMITRSPIGQRYKAEHPKWVERASRREPPRVIRSEAFAELGWACRRVLPVAGGLTTLATLDYLTDDQPLWGLTPTAWLTTSSVIAAVFATYLPFATFGRIGPLSKWASFCTGGSVLAFGLGLATQQVVVRSLGSHISWMASMDHWAQNHTATDALSWAASLAVLGLTIVALGENSPSWEGSNTPGREDPLRQGSAIADNRSVRPGKRITNRKRSRKRRRHGR